VPAAFTSLLAEAVAPDLLARFTRYVQIDTQSRVDRERSAEHTGTARPLPSPGRELHAIGVTRREAWDESHGAYWV